MSIDKTTYSFQQNELSGNDLVHRMSARDTTFHNRHEFFGVSTREYNFFSNTLISLSLDSKEALRVCNCSSVWVCNACRVLGYIVGYFYAYLKERAAKKSKKRGR